MKTRILKVVSPLGTFTRETARDYKFLVVSKGTTESVLIARRAADKAAQLKLVAGYIGAYTLAYETQLAVCRMDGSSYNEAQYLRQHNLKAGALVTGAGIGYYTAKEWAEFIASSNEREADEAASFQSKLEANRNAAYIVEGWCSRLDLAQKLVAIVAKRSRENIAIINVQTGEVL